MILDHPTKFAHFLLDQAIRPGDVVIDATVGHGDDTLFLAERVADFGQVYGFEIQKEAIEASADRLTKANQANQVTLLNQGHERIITALPPELKVQAAIFSLGALSPDSFESIYYLGTLKMRVSFHLTSATYLIKRPTTGRTIQKG